MTKAIRAVAIKAAIGTVITGIVITVVVVIRAIKVAIAVIRAKTNVTTKAAGAETEIATTRVAGARAIKVETGISRIAAKTVARVVVGAIGNCPS